jgi:hypothetical protein
MKEVTAIDDHKGMTRARLASAVGWQSSMQIAASCLQLQFDKNRAPVRRWRDFHSSAEIDAGNRKSDAVESLERMMLFLRKPPGVKSRPRHRHP